MSSAPDLRPPPNDDLRFLRLTPAPVAIHQAGRLRFLNDAALQFLDISAADELLGSSVVDLVHSKDRELVRERIRRVEQEGEPTGWLPIRLRRRDGTPREIESRGVPITFEGAPATLSTIRDATGREAEVRRLRESEERYRQLFLDSLDAVYVTAEDGRILEMNPAGLEMFGCTEAEIRDTSASQLYADPADRIRFQREITTRGSVSGYEVRLRRRDGEVFDALITATVNRSGDGTPAGYKGIIRDITERKEFEEQLERRALHDPLTELPNRALFWDRLEHAVGRASRGGSALAVLFLDLDRFKQVNDSLGHISGDRLLAAVAHRLVNAVRQPDTVARFGGDEFIVLLEDVSGPDDVRLVAERILDALETPVPVRGAEIHVTASIGIVMSRAGEEVRGDNREWGEELVRRADRAMYRAKGQPGTRFCIYDPTLDEEGRNALHRETEMRRGIDEPEFLLHYQPIVHLGEGRIVAVEALCRWDHPERGLLYPGDFLPVAEESGLIVPLGEWILEAACRQVARWNEGPMRDRPLFLHVNVSPRQFEAPDFVATLCDIIERTGITRKLVEVEITEHLVFQLRERARELRDLGIGVSVDDFGTGYSSLGYIKHLSADVLKIDQNFVQGIDTDLKDRAIVKMILSLSQTLGLDVVAEGVETEAQLEHLRELECGWAQGFHFARPLPAAELERLLKEDPRW